MPQLVIWCPLTTNFACLRKLTRPLMTFMPVTTRTLKYAARFASSFCYFPCFACLRLNIECMCVHVFSPCVGRTVDPQLANHELKIRAAGVCRVNKRAACSGTGYLTRRRRACVDSRGCSPVQGTTPCSVRRTTTLTRRAEYAKKVSVVVQS